MLWFWAAAASLAGVLALLVLLRAAGAKEADGKAAEAAVHQRRLAEIDELARQMLISPEDAQSVRAEAGRGMLAATRHEFRGFAAGRVQPALVLLSALAAPLVALGLHLWLGSPQLDDQPFEGRVAAWRQSEPQDLGPAEMAAVLRQVVEERPGDVRPLMFLARAQALAGEEAQALSTLRRAATLDPSRAEIWSLAGELQTAPKEAPLTASARAAFEQALSIDPTDPISRYFLGRDLLAQGRREDGLRAWRRLLADLAPSDPRRASLAAELAARTRPSGPAAKAANETGQDLMIAAMVERQAARLRAQPDDVEGWARLIRSYGVLGRTAERDAAVREARGRFASRPERLRQIDAAVSNSSDR